MCVNYPHSDSSISLYWGIVIAQTLVSDFYAKWIQINWNPSISQNMGVVVMILINAQFYAVYFCCLTRDCYGIQILQKHPQLCMNVWNNRFVQDVETLFVEVCQSSLLSASNSHIKCSDVDIVSLSRVSSTKAQCEEILYICVAVLTHTSALD